MNVTGTVVKVAIHKAGSSPIYSEGVIGLELTDEAAGPFFLLSAEEYPVRICIEELEMVLSWAKNMLSQEEKNMLNQEGGEDK